MQERRLRPNRREFVIFSLSIVILSGAIVYLSYPPVLSYQLHANNSKGKYIFSRGVIFLLVLEEEKQIISKN